MTTDNIAIERLIELLGGSRRGVVFTGAGISTESGIPDFRSPGGIWSKYRLIDFQEFMASEQARREYWRRKFGRLTGLARGIARMIVCCEITHYRSKEHFHKDSL